MREINPVIRRMTLEEMSQYNLQNFGLAIDHKSITYRLSGGTMDIIHVFESGPNLFVLSINRTLSYVGLDAYVGEESDPVRSAFFQYEWELYEYVGRNWRDLTPVTLTEKLIYHLA